MSGMGKPRQSRKDLPARVYQKHGAYYFVDVSNKWHPLGKDYGAAMQKWAAMVQPAIGKQRMGAVMDAYIKEQLPARKPRTQKDYLSSITMLRPVFGEMWPEDIEPKDIYAYMRLRNAPVRANRDVAVLSNVMNQAIRMGLVNANPCKQVRRNEEHPRTREVLDSEIVAFLPHCPAWLQAYIRLKLLTGLRQGDMLTTSASISCAKMAYSFRQVSAASGCCSLGHQPFAKPSTPSKPCATALPVCTLSILSAMAQS
jgi:hypothetical protein